MENENEDLWYHTENNTRTAERQQWRFPEEALCRTFSHVDAWLSEWILRRWQALFLRLWHLWGATTIDFHIIVAAILTFI